MRVISGIYKRRRFDVPHSFKARPTTDFAKEKEAGFILRSIRSVKDYEYELNIADINRQLSGIETVLLLANPEMASISSSVVRELAGFGHDIQSFIPQGFRYNNIEQQ